MSNPYYVPSGTPGTGAFAASAAMRSEFGSIEDGFDLLPTLSGAGSKAVVVNSDGTALETTTGTLALAGNFATSGASALTLTTTGATNVTLPTTGTLATLAGAETLTNKTISGSSNTLSSIANASLSNSSVTVNGTAIALGDSATITAAAGTLTGATLAAGVTASSLTSVGTLTSLTVSGALTYGGVALSAAVTGTGSMVLSTSPTLTTPLLGTPTSGNLTNCTGYGASALAGTTLASGVTASSLTSVGTLGSLTVAGVTTISTNNAAPLMITRAAAGANVSIQISNNDGSWFVGKGSGGDFNVDTDSTIGASPKLALTTAGALSVASLALTAGATVGTSLTVGTTLGVSGATTLTGDLTANSIVTFNGSSFQCNADLYAGRMGASVLASTTTHLNIDASTTGVSSLRIAAGVAPTAPVDGDVWTTTTALFIRLNGVTKTVTLT